MYTLSPKALKQRSLAGKSSSRSKKRTKAYYARLSKQGNARRWLDKKGVEVAK